MTYLVFAGDEDAEWHVEQGELTRALLRDWPNAEIQEPTPSDAGLDGRGLRWTCRIGDGEVEAWLNKEGTCFYIDGELRGAASVAAWFRGLMPQSVEFAMCDDSYSFHLVIEDGSSAFDIAESIPD
ncbi:hypothetical protein [Streptomyces sp. NPDC059398]|uniref:hypothetical protein n=1 Tax=Streptomyces sp. NPDC059398 TaxID=3346820 RepID=UPI0036A3D79B